MFPPSSIQHFYPKTFEVDLNDHKYEYQGVVKIPFIDVNQVRQAYLQVKDLTSPEEEIRNTLIENFYFQPRNPINFPFDASYIHRIYPEKQLFQASLQGRVVSIFYSTSYNPSFMSQFYSNI